RMMKPKANQRSSVGMIDIMTSRTRHCTVSLQEFSVASAASGSPFCGAGSKIAVVQSSSSAKTLTRHARERLGGRNPEPLPIFRALAALRLLGWQGDKG